MADEKEKKENEYDQTWEILNSPIFLLLLGAGLIVGLYYLISPYQDCLREIQQHKSGAMQSDFDNKHFCWKLTSW